MIKEWISMTKVARLFEEEKIDAINKAVADIANSLAKKMLLDDKDIIEIMKYSQLTKDEVLKIKRDLEYTDADGEI